MGDDGGSAFPIEWGNRHSEMRGMTLRDYFAAKAMQGLLAAGRDAQYGESSAADLSRATYMIADEMLAARGAA